MQEFVKYILFSFVDCAAADDKRRLTMMELEKWCDVIKDQIQLKSSVSSIFPFDRPFSKIGNIIRYHQPSLFARLELERVGLLHVPPIKLRFPNPSEF